MFKTEEILAATKKNAQEMIKANLAESDKWVQRAILAIYARQTESEKHSSDTEVWNNIGFSSCHANFMSSLAQRLNLKLNLSEKQMVIGRKIISKYSRQLLDIMIQNNKVAA